MRRAPMNLAGLFDGQPEMQPLPIAFNPPSEELLSGVNPTLAELMRRVEAQMPDAFEITEGMRDRERQAQLFAQGKSQTMNSKHLTGNAVDIHVVGPDGQPNWDFEAYRPIADAAKAEAAAMGLPDFVWGGDWETLRDGVHFQIGGPGGPGTPSAGPAPRVAFGNSVPAAPGLGAMFGPEGLSMGLPVSEPRRPGDQAREQMADRQDDATKKRQLLASLIRY